MICVQNLRSVLAELGGVWILDPNRIANRIELHALLLQTFVSRNRGRAAKNVRVLSTVSVSL